MARSLHQALKAGEYQRGIDLFDRLARPSAQDYRWGGACCFRLGDMFRAHQLFLTAIARGEVSASVDLAICLRFEGKFDAARSCLAALDVASFSARDAALTLRESAVIAQQDGDVVRAVALLDESWSHAVAADATVQATIAQSIALIAAQQGDDHKADAYLRFAERHASPTGRMYVHLAKVASALNLGRYEEAKRALEAAEGEVTCSGLAAALLAYRWGCWHRAAGEVELAKSALRRAIQLARVHHQPETELYAHLILAALATAEDDEASERGSLARAQALAKTPHAQAHVDWRVGTAMTRRGDPDGRTRLDAALTAFQTGGSTREVVGVQLHLVEAHLRLGSTENARHVLREATDTHEMLGGQQQLAVELRCLERTRHLLESFPSHAYERALFTSCTPDVPLAEICLTTLNTSVVCVNRQRVRFQMRKTVEILTYLLNHRTATLNALQGDIFASIPASRSKNYIHQARLELKRLVPGLSVPYNAQTQTYRVDASGVRLVWDVQQLRDDLADSGPERWLTRDIDVSRFLQESESEWVQEERERMSRWIIRVGLETMDAWYGQGEYDKCLRLARRLIEIEPLDEGLHDFLIRATTRSAGLGAARAVWWESRRLFEQEVGHLPPVLDSLGQTLFQRQVN